MASETTRSRVTHQPQEISIILQLFALFGGPFSWVFAFLLNYFFATRACSHLMTDAPTYDYVLTIITGLITISAGVVGWRIWTRAREIERNSPSTRTARIQFFGLGGIVTSMLFLFGIILLNIPFYLLPVCHS